MFLVFECCGCGVCVVYKCGVFARVFVVRNFFSDSVLCV